MNLQALFVAGGVGLLLQLAMVWAGHRNAFVRNYLFALGGMTISLSAGLIYGHVAGEPWGPSLVGGALAGGGCALAGILVSFVLKDVPVAVLAFGTLASAATGALGAVLGRLLN